MANQSPTTEPTVAPVRLPMLDEHSHYWGDVGPIEHEDLVECPMAIANIGWTLGNFCPYHCSHCYSMNARRRGMDLERWMVDRIVTQLRRLQVHTVNLGGNEPVFTHGTSIEQSLLGYIIRHLTDSGIVVGLTTSGVSLTQLDRLDPAAVGLLNDVDVSFDSPYPHEHNRNRGAALFDGALRALDICAEYGIDRTIITCAMSWNFSAAHIDALIALARRYQAHIRVNPLKPVQSVHMATLPSPVAFYEGFSRLMAGCDAVDLGEPLLAAATGHKGAGCPCGRTSFRIHSITPDGRVPVSPCVYLHEYKTGDLLRDDVIDIVHSPQFRSFRRRNANPQAIPGCDGCAYVDACRGGCAARSYLHTLFENGRRTLFVKDPYCLRDYRAQAGAAAPSFPQDPPIPTDTILVHRDYLCTWIGTPRDVAGVSQ
jgi:radical SAM protein with 4Fe4S-binding SPASM domain